MPDEVTGQVIDPQPGLAHPATRAQQWHGRHLWGLIALAATWPVMGIVIALVDGPTDGRSWLFALTFGVAGAAPFLLLAWYVDPNVRQRRYLRKYPWVQYDASVAGFALKTLQCIVTFTDDTGATYRYKLEPNDDDYERGSRPLWFAGVPGKVAAVVSLREGACTSMAYRTSLAPGGGPVPGAARPAAAAPSRREALRAEATRRGLQVSPDPTPAPDHPEPQPQHSRVVTSGPAADDPVTRQERVPARRSWVLGFATLVLAGLALSGDMRWPWQHGVSGWVLIALLVLCATGFLLLTERRRIGAVLRAHPWVEFPAEVEPVDGSTGGGKVTVRITDDTGTTWSFPTYPPRGDFALGPRPVWCAGTPGRTALVISLDRGGCVSLAQGMPLQQRPHTESA